MAKKSNKKAASGFLAGFSRLLATIWRGIAKALGATVRAITKGAKDLDPEHQRDGIGFLLLILGLIAAAASWLRLDNWFGDAAYSFFYGAVGRVAVLTPILFGFFALRLFRSPQDKAANGRILIGSILMLISVIGSLAAMAM